MKLIKLEDAARIACRPSAQALTKWIARYNHRHPEKLIRRLHGRVELESLLAAIENELESRATKERTGSREVGAQS